MLSYNYSGLLTTFSSAGIGYGLDAGMHFVYNVKRTSASLPERPSLGNTSFLSGGQTQNSNLTFGLGLRIASNDMIATLAYDYSHIFENIDWRRKVHMGLELKFPLISLSVGLNQLYLCYGASLDISIIKLQYVSYAEEVSSSYGVDAERRNLFQLVLKFAL